MPAALASEVLIARFGDDADIMEGTEPVEDTLFDGLFSVIELWHGYGATSVVVVVGELVGAM